MSESANSEVSDETELMRQNWQTELMRQNWCAGSLVPSLFTCNECLFAWHGKAFAFSIYNTRATKKVFFAVSKAYWVVFLVQQTSSIWHITKQAKWPVLPAKTHFSLGIRPVWSESLLSSWRSFVTLSTNYKACNDNSDQTGRFISFVKTNNSDIQFW